MKLKQLLLSALYIALTLTAIGMFAIALGFFYQNNPIAGSGSIMIGLILGFFVAVTSKDVNS